MRLPIWRLTLRMAQSSPASGERYASALWEDNGTRACRVQAQLQTV
jgi:hypothetical protein